MRGLGAVACTNDQIKTSKPGRGNTKGFTHCPLHAIAGHGIAHGFRADREAKPGKPQFVGSDVDRKACIGHATSLRVDRVEISWL